jgi:hypothetical protein
MRDLRSPWMIGLLWLALALLPMRGMANAVMHLQHGLAAGAQAGHPCHDEAAQAQDRQSDRNDANQDDCSSCELCHAGMLANGLPTRLALSYQPPRVEARLHVGGCAPHGPPSATKLKPRKPAARGWLGAAHDTQRKLWPVAPARNRTGSRRPSEGIR